MAQPARSNRLVEVLSEHQCRELLASRDLGRISSTPAGPGREVGSAAIVTRLI